MTSCVSVFICIYLIMYCVCFFLFRPCPHPTFPTFLPVILLTPHVSSSNFSYISTSNSSFPFSPPPDRFLIVTTTAGSSLTVTMSSCSRKALTLLSSVFAISGLGLLGVAVSTDYWLYLEEGVILPLNQSIVVKTSLHSGLWRVCFLAGEGWVWGDALPRFRTGFCQ